MRIGMILDKTFPPDPRVENEAISLIAAGHQVFLFCLKYKNEPAAEVINGIEVKRYLSNTLTYKLSALAYTLPFYTLIMTKKIRHFLNANGIEAIHIHDIRIADAVFRANKKSQLPTVLDLHDNMPEIMKFYPHLLKFPGKQSIDPKKWKEKEEEFIHKAVKVVTVSDEFKDEVVKRIPIKKSKIVVVPNTVRSSFYTRFVLNNAIISKYKQDFVILYLGDTGLRRGLLTAINAMPGLKESIKNVRLVIVGQNTTDTALKARAKELKVDQYIDFEGWQNISLFPSYIMASAVCISPLHRNIQHDVAYANKLFQYMSFAKPLVVSDATAQKNLVTRVQCGLIHKDNNSDDFSEKILQLYQDKSRANNMGANGKAFIKNEFNWQKTSTKLIALYDQLSN